MSTSLVTLERYAEIRAEMETGKLRDEVLLHAGIRIEQWSAVQREWLEKMGMELQHGKFELTNRYTQAFLERQRALKGANEREAAKKLAPAAPMPTGAAIPPAPPDAAFVMPAAPPAVAADAMTDRPPAFVAPPRPAQAETQNARIHLATTLDIAGVVTGREALPFDPSASPSLPVPNAARPATKERSLVGATLDMDDADTSAPLTLPFDRPSTGGQQQPAETMDIETLMESGAAPKAALPFDPNASAPTTVPNEKVSIEAPPKPKTAAQIGGTLDISAILQAGNAMAGATPFEQRAPAAQPSAPNPGSSTINQGPKGISESPPMPLERYASLCVDYAAAPAQAAEIAARYGLNAKQWAQVDAYWRRRMESESDVRAAWEKACLTYRQWLAGR